MGAGNMTPRSPLVCVEVTQAEELWVGTLGVGHVHVCQSSVSRFPIGKQGHVHSAILTHQRRMEVSLRWGRRV